MAIIHETIWPIIVARAPPFTPWLNTKIKIGSNIILIMAPINNITIAYFGELSALIILDKAV